MTDSVLYHLLFVIHLMVTIALIGIILVQRNNGDMGLSSSSNSFMSGRTAASLVTRATGGLATAFILLSLAMGIITARGHTTQDGSIMDKLNSQPAATAPATTTAPATQPAAKEPAKPAVPRPE